MNVRELIELLEHFPADALVICQRDGEGNGYSPLDDVTEAVYEAESTWSGQAYDPADEDTPDGCAPCILLQPVN